MKGFQEFTDLYRFSKGSLYRLILDENIGKLEAALEDEGYTVHVLAAGLTDDQIKKNPGSGVRHEQLETFSH
jgi:hypothetical protein